MWSWVVVSDRLAGLYEEGDGGAGQRSGVELWRVGCAIELAPQEVALRGREGDGWSLGL